MSLQPSAHQKREFEYVEGGVGIAAPLRHSVRLDRESWGELELVLNGGFRPMQRFLGREDWDSVTTSSRLADGRLWPVPLSLTLPEPVARRLATGGVVAVQDDEGVTRATVAVSELWKDPSGVWRAAGLIDGVEIPPPFELRRFRLTPTEVRARLSSRGCRTAIGASPGALLAPARKRALLSLAHDLDAMLVLLPTLGGGFEPALDPRGRLLSLLAAFTAEERERVIVMALPLLRRYRPEQALLLRAIVARNCGCTHVAITDEGAAGPWTIAQPTLDEAAADLGITWVRMPIDAGTLAFMSARCQQDERATVAAVADGREPARGALSEDVLAVLRRTHPPRRDRGFTVFFTGLSGAGKSTIARALKARLEEQTSRPVTLLDGDVVRTHLSTELGFSREHRDLNVRRIGFVAAEITRHRGIAICAPIAPYEHTRRDVRRAVQAHGGFVLVHVSTSLALCERRDTKGLYAKARAGELPEFTGISDPYEVPLDPAVTIDTGAVSPEEAATRIVDHLVKDGYLAAVPVNGTVDVLVQR